MEIQKSSSSLNNFKKEKGWRANTPYLKIYDKTQMINAQTTAFVHGTKAIQQMKGSLYK